MNIVCIDPSLSCTAVVVNDKKAAFVSSSVALTKTLKYNKWFDLTLPYADIITHDVDRRKLSFSDSEVSKFSQYDTLTSNIVEFISQQLSDGHTKVYIEGYSFSSAAGPLIDLVTFGTLLRYKLRQSVSHDIVTITPSELKMYAAMFSYQPLTEGKKQVWRNRDGISGGKFKKPEMFKAIIENADLQCEWSNYLREHASDILEKASIPKPIEDINDAKLMYEIAKTNKYI